LLAGCNVLLSHLSRLDDVIVGCVVEGSNPRELAGVVGLKGNVVALRTDLSGNPTFRGLLRRVRRVTLDALDHQDLPFEELGRAITQNGSATPRIQVMFSHTRLATGQGRLPGLKIGRRPNRTEAKQWGLSFVLIETDETLTLIANFDTDRYDRATMVPMVADYRALLARAADDPDLRLSELRLVE
jgi:non-ribosomal peptide synthetase component F